jgi:hypothetical protein
MASEEVEFMKAVGVEESIHALAGEQLALLMLALY